MQKWKSAGLFIVFSVNQAILGVGAFTVLNSLEQSPFILRQIVQWTVLVIVLVGQLLLFDCIGKRDTI